MTNRLLDFLANPGTEDVRNKLADVVTHRAAFFPAADYADGSTRWAWPGAIADPVQAWGNMLAGDTSPQNALAVAGAATVGGMAFERPWGSLGAGGRPGRPRSLPVSDLEIAQHFANGKKHSELADMYGVPPTTIATAIQRARAANPDANIPFGREYFSAMPQQDMVNRLLAGEDLTTIAQTAGVGPAWVRQNLKAYTLDNPERTGPVKRAMRNNRLRSRSDIEDD